MVAPVLAAVRTAHALMALPLAERCARCACNDGSFSFSRHPEERSDVGIQCSQGFLTLSRVMCWERVLYMLLPIMRELQALDPYVALCAPLDDEKRKDKGLCYKSYLLAIVAAISFSNDCFAKKTSAQKSAKSAVCNDVCVQKSFAIVNLEKVASRCKAGRNIEKQMIEINEQSKKVHLEQEDRIKLMEDNKTSNSDNDGKIEESRLLLYDKVRTKRQQITEAYTNAISELENVMKKIIESVATRDGLGVVITSQAVVYACKDCRDITDDVIKEIDNACKTIKVEMKE